MSALAIPHKQRDLAVMSQRLNQSIADTRALLHAARIKTYGRGWFMTFFLTYFQHRMVHQDGPKQGQFIPPAKVHYKIAAVIEEALAGLVLKFAAIIEVFRGAAKTTLAVEAGAIAAVIKGRKNIIIVSATRDEAKARIQAITHELTSNERLIADHPELARGKDDKGQWISYTDYTIVFANGARIRAYAVLGKLRGLLWNGARPDFVLIDDGEDDELQESETRLRKAKRWLRRVLVMAMSAFAALLWIGTPLSPNCLLYWARDPVDGMGISASVQQEFYDNAHGSMEPHPAGATPHWPEAWPQARIEREYTLIGYHGWMQEARLIPLYDELAEFKAEWFDSNSFDPRLLSGIGTGRPEYHGQALTIYSWWDGAQSLNNKAARTALVTVGLLRGALPRVLVLEVRAGRWSEDVTMEQLRGTYATWRPLEIGAQATIIEKAIGPAALRQYAIPFRAYPISNAADAKHARIRSLSPHAKAGQLLFNHDDPMQKGDKGLRSEFVTYPFSPTNDILDALEGAFKLALTGSGAPAPTDLSYQPIVSAARGELSQWG